VLASSLFLGAGMALCDFAMAGPGLVASVDANHVPVAIPTFFANSPAPAGVDPLTGSPIYGSSGTPLRKFIDTLPGLGAANANDLGQYIPVAVTDTTSYPAVKDAVSGKLKTPAADYYELGIVEYSEQLHADLVEADGITPHPTKLRGYVQIETPALRAGGAASAHVPLSYPDGSPILYPDLPAIYGALAGTQIYAVDNPHYLGPAIVAQKGRPVRLKVYNLLPRGHFDPITLSRGGDLFLPVDRSTPGAGDGPFPEGCTPSVGGVAAAVKPCEMYTENRAGVSLQGGATPWISAGTPHQWMAPAGEATAYAKGAASANVPDMPDPGPGAATFYWPNAQSARLMIYRDNSYGIARLNDYAGLVAPCLLRDPVEQGLVAAKVVPADEIPLIIQDKTFVPQDVSVQDARWDGSRWGAPGDLWFPHVYEAKQSATAPDGVSAAGRWDYGPLFWPPLDASTLLGPLPEVSGTPDAYMDTPLVNGTAYPSLALEPRSYRLRVVNAANDRMFNLGLYLADDTVRSVDGRPDTEVRMVPAQTNAAFPLPSRWPVDGRDGGVPDPTTAGPDILQIGNEGGLLPQVAVVASTPMGYAYAHSTMTALDSAQHGLLLAPGEQADAVVDFSPYAGRTLILYNDAPAPGPVPDPRNDYCTGDPDQSVNGGAPTTLAGFGPNTRTLLQIVVAPKAPSPPFDLARLRKALPAAFAAAQAMPVVPEREYGDAYGASFTDRHARIFDLGLSYTPYTPDVGQELSGVSVLAGGHGYRSPPTVVIAGGGGKGARAVATVADGRVVSVALTDRGAGYTSEPSVSFAGGGSGASAAASTTATRTLIIQNKSIQEHFELSYGRMNATLGYELPLTRSNGQTNVPLGYIDPATDSIGPGDTQIWRITHHGIDTHAVHFDLLEVQLINRVDWQGTIKSPEPAELGWKNTIHMNPLEDVIVAVRARLPELPFKLGDSLRPLDVTRPLGSTLGFARIAGQAPTLNAIANFGAEYDWCSQQLGLQANDMLRPLVVASTATAAAATPANAGGRSRVVGVPGSPHAVQGPSTASGAASPNLPAFNYAGGGAFYGQPLLTFFSDSGLTDTPPADPPATAPAATAGGVGSAAAVAAAVAGIKKAQDSAADKAKPTLPNAPDGLAATVDGPRQVTLNWSAAADGNVTSMMVERCAGFIDQCANRAWQRLTFTLPRDRTRYVDETARPLTAYTYRVKALSAFGASPPALVQANTPMLVEAPADVAATPMPGRDGRVAVMLTWTDRADNETGFVVERAQTGKEAAAVYERLGAGVATVGPVTGVGGKARFVDAGAQAGSNYVYRVRAVNVSRGVTTWSAPAQVGVDWRAVTTAIR
jgi:FtsP/CotA-like multicopper oxidase with cupredoxin domain